MPPFVQLLSFLPLALAAKLRRIERRAIVRLRDAEANTAERAILLDQGGRISDFVYRRLAQAGALQRVGDDRYYLSRPGYDRFRARRRSRALVVLGLVLGGLAVGFYWGVFA